MFNWLKRFAFADVPFDSKELVRTEVLGVPKILAGRREGETYVQSNCRKTSSKKGTPATIPYMDGRVRTVVTSIGVYFPPTGSGRKVIMYKKEEIHK